MFARIALSIGLAFAAGHAFAAAETYTLDPGHTDVVFTWNHFGYSNPSGHFKTIEGTLVFDEADPTRSSVEVTIPVSGIDTHVDKLDRHLQAEDFLDAAKYPTITFKSTKVERGASKEALKVTGDLSLHGVTRPVTLAVKINKIAPHPMSKTPTAGFDATMSIKRSEFGVDKYVPMVSDRIDIRITTEANQAKPAA